MKTEKESCSKEVFGLDWTAFFEANGLTVGTDTITSSTWTLTDGTLGLEFIDGAETTVFVEGGTPGVTAVLENIIEINGGTYRDCRKIYIEVN